MTDPNTSPGAVGSPAPSPSDAGGQPSSVQPANGNPPQASPDDAPGGLIGKVRSDPDFAEKKIREFQSRMSKAEHQLSSTDEKLGALKGMIEQGYTGDQIHQALQAYQTIAQDPKLAPVLKSYFETGQLQIPSGNGSGSGDSVDDDYKTPEERKIEALEAQIKTLQGEFHGTSSSFAEQQLERHIEKAASDFGVAGEPLEKAKESLRSKLRQASQTDQGRGYLQQLTGENGYRTVRTLFLDEIGPEALVQAAEQKTLRGRNARARLATDGPSQIGTTGDQEPLPDFGKGQDAAKNALEFFMNHPERNPYNVRE